MTIVTQKRLRLPKAALPLVTLAAVGLALSSVEIVLVLFDKYPPPAPPWLVPQRTHIFQADARVGYRMHPSIEKTYRYPRDNPELTVLRSNASGFRNDREFHDGDERFRVFVLGDSFVFGSGVAASERFSNVLEALEPAWRVDNIGMPGWGLDLMMRALDEVSEFVRPDMVVLALISDDFRRLLPPYTGLGFPYPKYELEGDTLVTVPFLSFTWWEKRRLAQAVYRRRWRRDQNRFELNEALLDRFLARSRERSFVPVVVFLPGTGDYPVDRERRNFLSRWTSQHDVAYLDLQDVIHGVGVDVTYFPNNPHWNATGHRVAAEAIHQFLMGPVVLGRRAKR